MRCSHLTTASCWLVVKIDTWCCTADVATADVHSIHVEAQRQASVTHCTCLGNGSCKSRGVLGAAALWEQSSQD
jgi:hypothetical protein